MVDTLVPQVWRCAFCGHTTDARTREHVVSKCLYDGTVTDPKVQRLVVPACKKCNNSWAKDETTFRNAVALTTYTPQTRAVFDRVMRSVTAGKYAEHEARRLRDMIRVVQTPTGIRLKIYPGGEVGGAGKGPKADPRVLRVVRKIVRGYSYEIGMNWPVPDEKVRAVINPAGIPADVIQGANYDHRDPRIFQCWYTKMPDDDQEIESAWAMCFYERIHFAAVVARRSSPLTFDHAP